MAFNSGNLITGTCIVLLSVGTLPAQPGVSVQAGNQEVSLTVTNMTQAQVVAVWVNFEGQHESYANLAPGQSTALQTYPGHLWRFGSGDQTLGEYRATAAAQQSYRVVGAAAARPAAPAAPGKQPVNPNPAKPAMTRGSGAPVARPVVENPRPKPALQGQPAAPVTNGSKMSAGEVQQLVGYHNEKRREVGVGAIAWDPAVAAFAQQWADHIARTGEFAHRPRAEQRYGENIAINASVLAGAKAWYGEKSLYRPGTAFDMSKMDAGHYTQMVWRGSTKLGAGKAIMSSGRFKGMVVLVCNYSPAGNMHGQKPY